MSGEDLSGEDPGKVAKRAEQLQSLLANTVHRAQDHRVTYKLNPFIGSLAAREKKRAHELGIPGRWVKDAFSVPWFFILAAEEHLESISVLVPRMPRISVAVLARGTLELSARAWWHLDPEIDIQERIRRALAEQLASNLELAGIEKIGRDEIGELVAPHILSPKRIEDVVKGAETLGFPVALNNQGLPKKGQVKLGEDERPGSRHLIEAMLTSSSTAFMGTFMWRHTSALAHGTLYALSESYRAVEDPFGTDTMAQSQVELADIEWLIKTALISHAEAFTRMTQIYGWDVDYWKKWCAQLLGELAKRKE